MDSKAIAARMPLSHFPANAVLDSDGEEGSPPWSEWDELRPQLNPESAAALGTFDRMRAEHVFLYAGPACFALSPDAFGDSVMYFRPDADANLEGHAAPFDTGCCKPRAEGGFLQPFASTTAKDCEAAITDNSVPLSDFRQELEAWLEYCHGEETGAVYLETSTEPDSDGRPLRTRPTEILESNGASGKTKYKSCADRRAWTWEVRAAEPLSLAMIQAIQVMPATLEVALRRSHELAVRHRGDAPRVLAVPGGPTSPRALYEDSERVLRILMGLTDE